MKLFRTLLTAVLFVSFSVIAYSQAANPNEQYERLPKDKLILGFQVGIEGADNGVVIGYALSPVIQIGTQAGIFYDSEMESTDFLFSPYAKYFFQNVKHFRPFAMLQFNVITKTSKALDEFQREHFRTETENTFSLAAGAEWFPYSSVSVYGGFKFLDYRLDPSKVIVGLGSSFIGISWYL